MGVLIEELNKQQTVCKMLELFFKRRKGKAFRPKELENEFAHINTSTIRTSLKRLYEIGVLKRKIICNNQSWYYYYDN